MDESIWVLWGELSASVYWVAPQRCTQEIPQQGGYRECQSYPKGLGHPRRMAGLLALLIAGLSIQPRLKAAMGPGQVLGVLHPDPEHWLLSEQGEVWSRALLSPGLPGNR